MPQASDSTVWVGLVVSLTAACAALFACAFAGARLVRRPNVTRRPALAALLASSLGLSIVSVGVARYLWPGRSGNQASLAVLERIELYTQVFVGALVFATSAITFCKLTGLLPLRVRARPGHDVVNAAALLLCGWLGYGFITEAAQPFGLAALLATSALASSIGVHLMVSRGRSKAYAKEHARAGMAIRWGDDAREADTVSGSVRAAAHSHGPRWHNSGNRQRDVHVRHRARQPRAARRLPNRSTVSRQP